MTEDDEKTAEHGAALARKALERLLARAENAASKGAAQTDRTGRTVTLPLSEKSFPEYLRLQRYADKAVCNANLQLAERDGAISVEWDSRAGERARDGHHGGTGRQAWPHRRFPGQRLRCAAHRVGPIHHAPHNAAPKIVL